MMTGGGEYGASTVPYPRQPPVAAESCWVRVGASYGLRRGPQDHHVKKLKQRVARGVVSEEWS